LDDGCAGDAVFTPHPNKLQLENNKTQPPFQEAVVGDEDITTVAGHV